LARAPPASAARFIDPSGALMTLTGDKLSVTFV
jgi:hypothetical protein